MDETIDLWSSCCQKFDLYVTSVTILTTNEPYSSFVRQNGSSSQFELFKISWRTFGGDIGSSYM